MTSRRNRTSQNRVGQRFGNLLVIAEGERIRYPGDPAQYSDISDRMSELI